MNLKKISSLIILLTLLVTSCGNPPSSNQNGSNQNINIEIQITGSEPKVFEVETISQPNCTGTAEVENTVQKSRTIAYTMESTNGVSVNANGQVGFAGTDVELGATVANQFGLSYGTSESLTRSITVKAGIGTNMQHNIQQVEIWKIGQAKISVGGQETIIPFKFRSDFSIELANSQNLGNCDALVTTPTTFITPTQPTIPTSEPMPTATISNIFQGSVTGTLETNVLLNLSDNQIIIGTADRYQDVKEQNLPPFAVFVIYGAINENITLPWGGWDQWLNATPNFIESELQKKIQQTKDNHSSDWMNRGINIYQCHGSVLNCTIKIVPTN